jgi:hypothetical protein
MITAIVVTALALLAIGIVINPLLRLKKYLNNVPPADPIVEPPEED